MFNNKIFVFFGLICYSASRPFIFQDYDGIIDDFDLTAEERLEWDVAEHVFAREQKSARKDKHMVHVTIYNNPSEVMYCSGSLISNRMVNVD